MFPIRKREHGGIYFAAACARDQREKDRCSKGKAAREEYVRVRDALIRLLGPEPAPPALTAVEPTLPFY
jgi:hypothetical protein